MLEKTCDKYILTPIRDLSIFAVIILTCGSGIYFLINADPEKLPAIIKYLNIILLIASVIIYGLSTRKQTMIIRQLSQLTTLLIIAITITSTYTDLLLKDNYNLVFSTSIILLLLFFLILIPDRIMSGTLATIQAIKLLILNNFEKIKNNTKYMKEWKKRRKKDAIEIKIKEKITNIKKSKHTLRNRIFYHRGLVEISTITEALLKLEAKEKYISMKLRRLKSKWNSDD